MSISDGVLANAANFNAAFDSKTKEFTSKTTTYQILAADTQKVIGCDPDAGSFNITLPALDDVRGEFITLIRTNSAASLSEIVTILPSGAETIDGLANKKMSTFRETYVLYAPNTGTTWQTVVHNILSQATSFTPTGSWSTNSTYTGYWWRHGKFLYMNVRLALSGAPDSASLTINLPTGLTIDTSELTSSDGNIVLGSAAIVEGGVASYTGRVVYSSTTALSVRCYNTASTYAVTTAVTELVPATFGNTDIITINTIGIPIVNWGG